MYVKTLNLSETPFHLANDIFVFKHEPPFGEIINRKKFSEGVAHPKVLKVCLKSSMHSETTSGPPEAQP